MNSTFCERKTVQIPEPRSKDDSSILHSTYTYLVVYTNPTPVNGFATPIYTSTLLWMHYTTLFFALHEFAR